MTPDKLRSIIEAVLLSAEHPMTVQQIESLFMGDIDCPSRDDLRKALHDLGEDYANRGFELMQVASGYRLQVKQEFAEWVGRLWEEKPAKYSRALLETIALVAYRQPITRGEIEDVRGVSVSSNIIKTLVERDWVKVLGHKDVPGKPALYGTTREFLDYFNLQSLDDLPTLAEIKDLDKLHPELELDDAEPENTPPAERSADDLENSAEPSSEDDIDIAAAAEDIVDAEGDEIVAESDTDTEAALDENTPDADREMDQQPDQQPDQESDRQEQASLENETLENEALENETPEDESQEQASLDEAAIDEGLLDEETEESIEPSAASR